MLIEMGKKARNATRRLSHVSAAGKNAILTSIAKNILSQSEVILAANFEDIAEAETAGLTPALIERLTLNPARLESIAGDLQNVIALPDPVGEEYEERRLANGLYVRKQRVPLGVLGVIYESRPNVTIDVAGLAIKSGNAVILRGGSETLRTNRALVSAIKTALERHDMSPDVVQLIDNPDRGLVLELLRMYQFVDMLIPRGGAKLHKFCQPVHYVIMLKPGVAYLLSPHK